MNKPVRYYIRILGLHFRINKKFFDFLPENFNKVRVYEY